MSDVTKKYNNEINEFDAPTLLMTNLVYSYRKINAEYIMQTGKKEISDTDKRQIYTNFATYIKKSFRKDYSSENIRQLMDLANWGIGVEQFRQEVEQISQDILQAKENRMSNKKDLEKEDKSLKEQSL